MILIITVLTVALLISLVGWWKCHKEKCDLEAVNCHKSVAEIKALEKISKLESELKETREHLSEITQSNTAAEQENEEIQQQGNFVQTRKLRPATPATFQIVFDLDTNGQRVLNSLTSVFCRDAFVPNEKGGERETCHRLGQQSVINFIINQINRANDPSYSEEENND